MKRSAPMTSIALALLGAATATPAAEPSAASSQHGATGVAEAAAAPTSAMPADDAAFLRQALQGGRREVAESRNAITRSTREDVRSTAQMLMTEHMSMNAELETLAAKKGWKAAEPSAPPQDPGQGNDPATASGADFDRSYVLNQIRDHERTISMFRRQATVARDADVRELAAKALPRHEQHLAALKKLAT